MDVSKRNKVKTIFFFLIGDYTTYDNNVSSSNSSFRSLINSVSDYVDVLQTHGIPKAKDIDQIIKTFD